MTHNRAPRLQILLLCAALLLPVGGCGGMELYERLLIHGIGVDRTDSGYTVTVRSAVSPGEQEETLYSCEGATVAEALQTLALSTGRAPFYAHNYLVVFGRTCAEEGLERSLDFFLRYHSTRPAVQLYLAEGTAEDILRIPEGEEGLRSSELLQLSDSSAETGQAVSVTLLDFMNAALRPGSSPVLPVLRREDVRTELVSTAFFRGFRLQGFLNGSETRGILLAAGRLRRGEMTFSMGEIPAAAALTDCRTGLSVEWEGGRLRVRVRATIIGSLSELEAGADPDHMLLERAVAESLLRDTETALRRTAAEQGCDVLGIGTRLYQRDPKSWRELETDWPAILAAGEYRVEITVRLRRLEQEPVF